MKTPLLLACTSAAVLTFSTLCKAQEMKKAPLALAMITAN